MQTGNKDNNRQSQASSTTSSTTKGYIMNTTTITSTQPSTSSSTKSINTKGYTLNTFKLTFTANLQPSLLTLDNPLQYSIVNRLYQIKERTQTMLSQFLVVDRESKRFNKMDETNPSNWNVLLDRDVYKCSQLKFNTKRKELAEILLGQFAVIVEKSDRELLLLEDAEKIIAYQVANIKKIMEIEAKLIKLTDGSVLTMSLEEYRRYNKIPLGYRFDKLGNNTVYRYFRLKAELAFLATIEPADVESVIKTLLTISQYKKMFVKQEITARGSQINGQYIIELLKSINPSIFEIVTNKEGHTRWKIADSADSIIFRNPTLFTYNEYITRAYKNNTWNSPKTHYKDSDWFTKNANKDIQRLKEVNVMNPELVGYIDEQSKEAIMMFNKTPLMILPSILDPEVIKELIAEDGIIKGLKGKRNNAARDARKAELQIILRAKYSTLIDIPLYRDTRLDIVSGRMHGGLMQGSKVERLHKIGMYAKVMTPEGRKATVDAINEIGDDTYSKRLKVSRLLDALVNGYTAELVESDATNQVMHILGANLLDQRLLSLGGGIVKGEEMTVAYTFAAEELKKYFDAKLKTVFKKKAKKIAKSPSYKAIFTKNNMKPLVMPIIYGKGITSSLFGSIRERDNTLGYTLCKTRAEIEEVYHGLQDENSDEENIDYSTMPIYWQLMCINDKLVTKEEITTVWKDVINKISPLLLPLMKYLQHSFKRTQGTYEAVAYNILGVSGVIQRKQKLTAEQQFHNTNSVELGEDPKYTTTQQIRGITLNGKELSVIATKFYNADSSADNNITPSTVTNQDATLMRYVRNTLPTNVDIFQIYDAVISNPNDVAIVAIKYKLGLKMLSNINFYPKFIKQTGGSRTQEKMFNLNFKGSVNPNSIPNMTNLIMV